MAPSASNHVLLADDSATFRELLAALLQENGFVVTSAGNGLEAMETFAANPNGFDVVILDIHMPFLGGIAAWESMDLIRPGVPVIFCTVDLEHYAPFLPRAPHIGGLVKPPTPELVLRELNQVLGLTQES